MCRLAYLTCNGMKPSCSIKSLTMEHRHLGASIHGPRAAARGPSAARGPRLKARPLIDICLEAGGTMFDAADLYSAGERESRRSKFADAARRH
jgi:aryl-alcohol dehydrogenase-like predicted oxidoreductase